MRGCGVLFLLTAALGSAWADDRKATQTELVFATQVWPVLKAKCLTCHGDDPKKLQGGLDLTTREATLRGGDSGEPAIVPGRPDESRLYVAVTRRDIDLVMPPKENDRLTEVEVEAVRRWIAGDAHWPSAERRRELAKTSWDVKDGVAVTTSGGLTPEWTNRKYKPDDLWAYRPVNGRIKDEARRANDRIEPSSGRLVPSSPIDVFVGEKMSELDLLPAPRADRRTLIRRATFDLTGLPPTPAEVAAFLDDPGSEDEAFARVVDRLLASPHYGEQWGRHWLDVARYADSSGFANDYERGNAWRYRDYVVRAFNADKPYDEFIREQLAGDEIDPQNPELLVAVGFLRMGPWELTGMEVPKVARQRFLDDVTEIVGQVFLAHPLQCARCHDHKFDPIPTRDYYRIQAAFATTQLAERAAEFLPAENIAGFDEKKRLLARRERLDAELKRIQSVEAAARTQWAEANPDKTGQKPPRFEFLSPTDLGLERIARKGLERLRWELDRYEPVALSVYSGRTPKINAAYAPMRMPQSPLTSGDLESTCILAGGDPFSPKDEVTPGVLSAVSTTTITDDIAGRRAALADWIASPANPLTARVMVNRIWQGHFGQAIAGSPNNFGATGKKPTHPELLDWLAAEFVERGWSVKAMHRLIMLSEAYRRASRRLDPATVAKKDPVGTSYAVFRPRRLAAEELLDAMLAASGELNRAIGGIPIRQEINAEVALQPRQVMGTFAPAWEPSPKPDQRHRRSLYVLKLRGLRDPFYEVFNQPGPDSSCEGRETSTVTPQVFSLLHSDATAGRALAFAARLLAETRSREDAVARAFQLAFGRPPTDAEETACLLHWAAMTARHERLSFDKPQRPREVRREAVEENTGERFTFTEVLESAADFVADLHPADVAPDVRGLMELCLVLFNANEFVYLD